MAGLCDREADGDLVELLEKLLLVHPEFPVLELGQQLGASRRLHPAPPFAPGSDLMSAASCQAPGRARTALTAEGAEGVLRAHVPASPPRAQRHSPMRACAPSRASRGVALVPPAPGGLSLGPAERRGEGRMSPHRFGEPLGQ